MDILELLRTSSADLMDSELDMLEEELAMGEFDAAYISDCKQLLTKERKLRKVQKAGASAFLDKEGNAKESKTKQLGATLPSNLSPTVTVAPELLSPFNVVEVKQKSPFEIVSGDVAAIRRSEKRKSLFREYVKQQSYIDEAFLDKNLSFFDDWETSAIMDAIQLSEPFLEKYFMALDPERIARTQHFSEEFFMKHFNDFNPSTVLLKGKNKWRTKDKRSKKLDMFLRLKGVQL